MRRWEGEKANPIDGHRFDHTVQTFLLTWIEPTHRRRGMDGRTDGCWPTLFVCVHLINFRSTWHTYLDQLPSLPLPLPLPLPLFYNWNIWIFLFLGWLLPSNPTQAKLVAPYYRHLHQFARSVLLKKREERKNATLDRFLRWTPRILWVNEREQNQEKDERIERNELNKTKLSFQTLFKTATSFKLVPLFVILSTWSVR